MLQENAIDAVHLLEKASGAKVKFVHVVRNPFDNLATMTLEDATVKRRNGDHQSKVYTLYNLHKTSRKWLSSGCL